MLTAVIIIEYYSLIQISASVCVRAGCTIRIVLATYRDHWAGTSKVGHHNVPILNAHETYRGAFWHSLRHSTNRGEFQDMALRD